MAEVRRAPEPGELLAGKYRVVERIGAGGMGVVYRAEHALTGKALALKWLHPQRADEPRASERLIREAQAAARIRHPNVVDVYDVAEEGGAVFLVMELLHGETLRERLTRGVLGVDECLALLLPALRAVAAGHREGVVHRDIKPENLFVTAAADAAEPNRVKVLDFGVSKLVDGSATGGTLTATGAPLGTPHYMSLEQLQAERDVDARTDVYAFGVVLYECLTGKRPFDGESLTAIVVKVATEAPLDPRQLRPELGAPLCEVVLKAMSRRRDDRQPSLTVLEEELRAAVRPLQHPGAERAGGASVPGRAARRRALAGLTFLAVAGALVAWLTPGAGAPEAAQPPATLPVAVVSSTGSPGASTASAQSPPLAASPPATAPATDPALPAGPTRRPAARASFSEGWVYLGDYGGGEWGSRYFTGWAGGLPAVGTTLTAQGRSFVRTAQPDALGRLASVRAAVGPDQPVELLERVAWRHTGLIWARVRPLR